MSFNRKFVNRALFGYVKGNPNKLLGDELDLRDWQANIHKGFECNREMITIEFWATNSTFKLSVHEIDDDGL